MNRTETREGSSLHFISGFSVSPPLYPSKSCFMSLHGNVRAARAAAPTGAIAHMKGNNSSFEFKYAILINALLIRNLHDHLFIIIFGCCLLASLYSNLWRPGLLLQMGIDVLSNKTLATYFTAATED